MAMQSREIPDSHGDAKFLRKWLMLMRNGA